MVTGDSIYRHLTLKWHRPRSEGGSIGFSSQNLMSTFTPEIMTSMVAETCASGVASGSTIEIQYDQTDIQIINGRAQIQEAPAGAAAMLGTLTFREHSQCRAQLRALLDSAARYFRTRVFTPTTEEEIEILESAFRDLRRVLGEDGGAE